MTAMHRLLATATLVATSCLLCLNGGQAWGEALSGEAQTELAKIRWRIQDVQNPHFRNELVILIENSAGETVIANLRWIPLKCNGEPIPLDPLADPRLVEIAGKLPRSFVIRQGDWRATSYPLGLPTKPGVELATDPSCHTELNVLMSTAGGRKREASIEVPVAPVQSGEATQ